jgi:hypothetical protein
MMLTHGEDLETESNPLPLHDILALSADHDQTIYVTAFRETDSRVPAFASQANGPFFTEGFSWKFADAPLRVTFVLSPEIARIRTSHDALTCMPSSQGKQEMVIPANEATYDFDVEFACGGLHDPKIIISPVKPGT